MDTLPFGGYSCIVATSSTLTERVVQRRNQRPSAKQIVAAADIVGRATGDLATKDRVSSVLAEYVPGDSASLAERLDRAGLSEQLILAKLREKLDATETQFFAKDGEVTDERETVAHHIQLKATRTALELRGLLQRGNRNQVNVGIGGNAQVAVAVPWSPSPVLDDNSTVDSNQSITTNRQNDPSTVTSTIEGTRSGRGAHTHSRRITKSAAIVPVHEMSDSQLKKISKQLRDEEQRRRLAQRSKRNKRIGKHVGPNHQGRKRGGGCKSGKCGRCRECIRRAKLRLP